MKPKVKITITEAYQLQEICKESNIDFPELDKFIFKLNDKRSLFERFYDYMTNLLSRGKSFAPNELKSF